MKQTAVEGLRQEAIQLLAQAMQGTLNLDTLKDDVYRIVTQAKGMERAQIMQAWSDCKLSILDNKSMTADQYYEQTYNNKEL